MKKTLGILMIMAVALFAPAGMATVTACNYDYSDASGYGTAWNQDPSWQRLGTKWNAESSPVYAGDTSDDGVFWSVNGGAYGHDAITVGDKVTFKFVMYKYEWGNHLYDYLKVWVDKDQNGKFDDGVFYQNKWQFAKVVTERVCDRGGCRNVEKYVLNDGGDAGQTPKTPYAKGDGLAEIYKTFYYTIDNFDWAAGEYWLRARVVCNADINSNPDSFSPYGYYYQGETEDWKLTVNKKVPEPGCLLLMGLGLLGLAGVRRKTKK